MATKKPDPVVPEVATSGIVPNPASPKWTALVEKFATTVSHPVEVVGPHLQSLVGTDDDTAVEMLENAIDTPDESVKALFAEDKIPPARLNKAIREMRAVVPVAEVVPASAPRAASPMMAASQVQLLVAPGDDKLFEALVIGGKPEFEPINISAVVRAAVASQHGLFGLPKKLQEVIRTQARATHKPSPAVLIQIRQEMAKRSDQAAMFGDLLPGFTGTYVTAEDKAETIRQLHNVWPSLLAFQRRLRAFRDEAFTAMMTGGMAAQFGGQALQMQGIDPSMLVGTSLETNSYVDDSSGIIDSLNMVFSDMGLYASRSLAGEAHRLLEIISKPELISAVGAANYEEMLRKLEIGMTKDIIRAQSNLVTWVLNVVSLADRNPAELPGVLLSLFNIGEQIPWDRLSAGKATLERLQPFQAVGTEPRPFPKTPDTKHKY